LNSSKRKTDLRPEKKTRTHCGSEKMLLAKLPLITAIDRYFLWLLIRMRVWTLGSAICNHYNQLAGLVKLNDPAGELSANYAQLEKIREDN